MVFEMEVDLFEGREEGERDSLLYTSYRIVITLDLSACIKGGVIMKR